MAKEVEISSNEREFVKELLVGGIRVDGRKVDEARKVEISLGEEYGYVDVLMGKTRVVVRISAELVEPLETRPFEGKFQVCTEISPMASAMFENNRQSDDELLISRTVEKSVRRSGALDLEALCVIAGAKCWSVRADVHFLDYDGGFIDASCLGVVVGLLHFRKNDVTISGEQVIIHPLDEREPVPLSVLHMPLCVSFAFFNNGLVEENIKGDSIELSLIDPTAQEELLEDGQLTIALNKNKEICQISKSGGLPVDATTLLQCANKALTIVEERSVQIKKLLKEDNDRRNKLMHYKELVAENDR